jgi:hypothetical protein
MDGINFAVISKGHSVAYYNARFVNFYTKMLYRFLLILIRTVKIVSHFFTK